MPEKILRIPETRKVLFEKFNIRNVVEEMLNEIFDGCKIIKKKIHRIDYIFYIKNNSIILSKSEWGLSFNLDIWKRIFDDKMEFFTFNQIYIPLSILTNEILETKELEVVLYMVDDELIKLEKTVFKTKKQKPKTKNNA